jgi:hypothetical protein
MSSPPTILPHGLSQRRGWNKPVQIVGMNWYHSTPKPIIIRDKKHTRQEPSRPFKVQKRELNQQSTARQTRNSRATASSPVLPLAPPPSLRSLTPSPRLPPSAIVGLQDWLLPPSLKALDPDPSYLEQAWHPAQLSVMVEIMKQNLQQVYDENKALTEELSTNLAAQNDTRFCLGLSIGWGAPAQSTPLQSFWTWPSIDYGRVECRSEKNWLYVARIKMWEYHQLNKEIRLCLTTMEEAGMGGVEEASKVPVPPKWFLKYSRKYYSLL